MENTTQARVNHAVSVMLRGRPSNRRFDGCFENDDARQVAARVWKRALKNERLMEILPRYLDAELCREDYERIKP